jgi:uridine kinase
LQRDTAERGRTRTQILEQLSRFTLPMSERFVAPQEKWADIVLDAPISAAQISMIVTRIQSTHKSLALGI